MAHTQVSKLWMLLQAVQPAESTLVYVITALLGFLGTVIALLGWVLKYELGNIRLEIRAMSANNNQLAMESVRLARESLAAHHEHKRS